MFTLLCVEQTALSSSGSFNLEKKEVGCGGAVDGLRRG